MYSPIEDYIKPVSLFKHDVKETNDSETISQMLNGTVSMDNRRWSQTHCFKHHA